MLFLVVAAKRDQLPSLPRYLVEYSIHCLVDMGAISTDLVKRRPAEHSPGISEQYELLRPHSNY